MLRFLQRILRRLWATCKLLLRNLRSTKTDVSSDLNHAMDIVARFHGAVMLLEKFDRENIRGRVETKEGHPPREFAIVATYLRTLAHVRTLMEFKSPAYFQAASMVARAIFELAVDIRLIDQIVDGPQRYDAFSKVERLRVARRIVQFHSEHPESEEDLTDPIAKPLEPAAVHQKYVDENAEAVDMLAKQYWPKHVENKRTIPHWSGKDLRQRAIALGMPFHEVYDVNYAELSWYTHPGVGAIAALDKEMYPLVCGRAYGIAIKCYCETLRFMIAELRIADTDKLIEKKLEFARLAAFSDNQEQANQLRRELLGF